MSTNEELLNEIIEDLRKNRFEYDCSDHTIFDRVDNKHYTIEQFVKRVNDIEYKRLDLINIFRNFIRF